MCKRLSFFIVITIAAAALWQWPLVFPTAASDMDHGEATEDHDGDGIADANDVDDDADGFPDCKEKDLFRRDHDNDEVKDGTDQDDDSDGVKDDADEFPYDNDNDGIPDKKENRFTDPEDDTDGDGILDRVELKRFRRDHDNDAVKDVDDLDDDADGIADSSETKEFRRDHDNDSKKDKRDLDDDGDGTKDYDEGACDGWFDADNDGVLDADEEAEEAPPSEASVTIDNLAFSPSTVTIAVGGTVTWTNMDSVPHTVTSDDGATFDSGTKEVGQTFSFTFTEAGTYDYHCDIHPFMTAKVIVE